MSWVKSITDRLLRIGGLATFASHLWGVWLAIGGGTLTAIVAALQGTLARVGFAGFVVVGLFVAILIFVLLRQISEYSARRKAKGRNIFISLDAAAAVVQSAKLLRTERDGVRRILQLASEGNLTLNTAKLLQRPKYNDAYDVGIAFSIDPSTVIGLSIDELSQDDSVESSVFGRFVLVAPNGDRYGRIRISLSQLLGSV